MSLTSSLYHHGAADLEVPQDNSVCDELRPYRPLDAARIRLVLRKLGLHSFPVGSPLHAL